MIDPVTSNALINAGSQVVPKIYDDALHPAAQETGKALCTLSKTINVALAPINWMVYGFEKIDERVKGYLDEKFTKENIPAEKITTPEAHIAVPSYEALRYSLDKDELRKLYINLIATSMIIDKKDKAHPAFVEVIKQLSPFDAQIINRLAISGTNSHPIAKTTVQVSESNFEGKDWFVHIVDPSLGITVMNSMDYRISIDNLSRLKLIDVSYESHWVDNSIYAGIENGEVYNHCKLNNHDQEYPFVFLKKGTLTLTAFGKSFISACVA